MLNNLVGGTVFILFFAGVVSSIAGCSKPIVAGERYILSADTLAASDEESIMALNNTRDDKDFQNEWRRLQSSDGVAVLRARTVVLVLGVHDAKAGQFVFVEVTYEGDTDVIMYRGHRYWLNARDLPSSY